MRNSLEKRDKNDFGPVARGFASYVRSRIAKYDACAREEGNSLTVPQCGRLTGHHSYSSGYNFDCFYWRWDSSDYQKDEGSMSNYSFFAFSPLNSDNAKKLDGLVKNNSIDADKELHDERQKLDRYVWSKEDYFFKKYREIIGTKERVPKGTHFIVEDKIKDYLDNKTGKVLFTHTSDVSRDEVHFMTSTHFFNYKVIRKFAGELLVPQKKLKNEFEIEPEKKLFSNPFYAFGIGRHKKAIAFAPNFNLKDIRYGTLVHDWPVIFDDGIFHKGTDSDNAINVLREMTAYIQKEVVREERMFGKNNKQIN